MIKGIVKIFSDPAKNVQVFESTESGLPLKRNGIFTATRTNNKGEYSINIPKGDFFYITFKLTGTDGATFSTNKVPLIVILNSNQTLPEFEIEGKTEVTIKKLKKFNYWWLLLLIPVIYKLSKKK
jgi:hypothetical protein